MEIKISPSMLASDYANLQTELEKCEKGGADLIHLDVMDGHFVPNISIGAPVIAAMKKVCAVPFDVHLMIDRPERYIAKFADAGADYITIHYEATKRVAETLKEIRSYNIKSGLVLKPETDVSVAEEFLPYCDMLLIMSVNPGFGGQKYIESSTEKIRAVRRLIEKSGREIALEIDGGITIDNIGEAVKAGADTIVAGSAVFNAPDAKAAISALKVAAES